MLSTITNFVLYHTPVFYLIQSVWRDEAFSYFMAKPNLSQVVVNTANDFNPPLYYLLLHFWIKLVGKSDVGLRFLSFLPHLLSVYIAYLIGKKLASKKMAVFLSFFTFFNPMLLYYALEIRMYSWYALFVFITFYFFYTKNWKWYIISGVLGLYTHSFFPFIFLAFISYLFLSGQANKKNVFYTATPFIFYLPWLPILIVQFFNSTNSWMFPVDFQLLKSVLGNLFTGFEGTPGNWWGYSGIISLFIIATILPAFFYKKKQFFLVVTPILLPLILILSYSIIKRPIYVNRYLIFVTVFEIIAIMLGIYSIRNKNIKNALCFFWLVFVITLNVSLSPYHKKTDFKTSFYEINKLANPEDFVFTKTPIGFLESVYYFRDEQRVFVYNPNKIAIPNYIGVNIVFPNISKTSFPQNSRSFLVADDASYEVVIKDL